MAYNTVADFVASEAPTATKLNDLKENVDFIRSPVSYHYRKGDGALVTTTSDTFVEYDSTNTSKTLDFGGGKVFIAITFQGDRFAMDLEIDGSRVGDSSLGLWAWELAEIRPFNLFWLIDGGLTGSKTIKLMWKRYGGSGTGRTSHVNDFTFDIIEL